jgi:hypothetical protein
VAIHLLVSRLVLSSIEFVLVSLNKNEIFECVACRELIMFSVRFEVFTAVTMKNGVFWDVTPCGSCKNRRFGGT